MVCLTRTSRYHSKRQSWLVPLLPTLTLCLCTCYNGNMLPIYPYATCWLDIVSTLADTIFGRVADMSADMSATCWADTHLSVDSTIFLTFKYLTFPAKTTMVLLNIRSLVGGVQYVTRIPLFGLMMSA